MQPLTGVTRSSSAPPTPANEPGNPRGCKGDDEGKKEDSPSVRCHLLARQHIQHSQSSKNCQRDDREPGSQPQYAR